jgi:uncharacterized protein YaiE (UPF0345 family)
LLIEKVHATAGVLIGGPTSHRNQKLSLTASLHFCLQDAGVQRYKAGMSNIPQQFNNVTVLAKANVYFDGKVVSHSILFADGSKKTIGLVYPGAYHFGTDKAERMELIAGQCRVKLDGQVTWTAYAAGQAFDVPAKSGFDIDVTTGICEYICSFIG